MTDFPDKQQYTIYNRATGQVIRWADDYAEPVAESGQSVLLGFCVDPATHYIRNHTPVPFPPQPSAHHTWCWTTQAWVPDLPSSVNARKHTIDAERNRRSMTPITYQSAPFDADALARERISGTLARLLRGDGLPSGWVGWRDADNNMHWVADPASSVQASLAGLSVAIEDREQTLLVAAWTHKHNISQLTTVEDVLAYDLSTGWPT